MVGDTLQHSVPSNQSITWYRKIWTTLASRIQRVKLKRSLHFQHTLSYRTERTSWPLHLHNKSEEGWGSNAAVTRQDSLPVGKLVQFTEIPLAKLEKRKREGGWLTQITIIKSCKKVVSAHEVVCDMSRQKSVSLAGRTQIHPWMGNFYRRNDTT